MGFYNGEILVKDGFRYVCALIGECSHAGFTGAITQFVVFVTSSVRAEGTLNNQCCMLMLKIQVTQQHIIKVAPQMAAIHALQFQGGVI